VASDVITEAANGGLLSATEKRRLHTYHAGRQLLTKSARLTYYWNRLARWAIIASFFTDTSGPQTYGTGVLQSPQARPALEELLEATSPARARKLPSGPSNS
jgi:hypothetical protein